MDEIKDTVKAIMATQLTETEVMVYLLVKNGSTYRDVAELPFGFSYETARTTFERAETKMDRLANLGLFSTTIK